MCIVARHALGRFPHAGGNGKQIFGDAWWLEPEEDARLAAELAGPHAQGVDETSASYAAAKASLGVQGDASSPCLYMTVKAERGAQESSWTWLVRSGVQGSTTPLSALSFDLGPSLAALNGSVHGSDLTASRAASVCLLMSMWKHGSSGSSVSEHLQCLCPQAIQLITMMPVLKERIRSLLPSRMQGRLMAAGDRGLQACHMKKGCLLPISPALCGGPVGIPWPCKDRAHLQMRICCRPWEGLVDIGMTVALPCQEQNISRTLTPCGIGWGSQAAWQQTAGGHAMSHTAKGLFTPHQLPGFRQAPLNAGELTPLSLPYLHH